MSMTLGWVLPVRRERRAAGVVRIRPTMARGLLAAAIVAGVAAGFLATGSVAATRAAASAGPDLTRVLRGMAMLKMLMTAACVGGMAWRLGSPVRIGWLGAYLAAAAAMAAGPGLIWDMAHLISGAVLLHGGLAVGVVLLWRDPAVGARLEALIAARRSALRARHGAM